MIKSKLLQTLIFSALSLSQSLWAVTRTVNTTSDDIDSNNFQLSLREAVLASKSGDLVRFASSLSGQEIELEHGSINVAGTVEVDAMTLDTPPTVTVSKKDASRLFDVYGNLKLKGVILAEGRSGGGADGDTNGGAIRCTNGVLTLENCVLIGNSSGSGKGGALYFSDSEVTLSNCVFSGNFGRRGGALACDDSTCWMRNCTVSGNRATEINGSGGVYFEGTGGALINSILWNNQGAEGGFDFNHSYTNVGSTPLYRNMLIEGRGMLGTDGLDGNDAGNDPNFKTSVDPGDAPTTLGSLQPRFDSPTLNAGDDAGISLTEDLSANPRRVGVIDLGAYEFQREFVYVDSSGSSVGDDGTTWATAFNFLSDGLASAVSGNLILIAEGAYFPDEGAGRLNGNQSHRFSLAEGVEWHGGFPAGGGGRDISRYVTVLSGDIGQDDEDADGNGITESHTQVVGANSERVVEGLSVVDVLVEGVTICGGRSNNGVLGSGAGAYLRDSEISFRECKFLGGYVRRVSAVDGSTSGSGGGVRLLDSDVDFDRCQFSGNFALFGGGLQMQGSSADLVSCYLSANEGSAISGAISDNSLVLTNCVVAGNVGVRGAGMNLAQTEATVTNCTFSGNSGRSAGGAIDVSIGSSCELINSIVWLNDSEGNRASVKASVNDPGNGMTYSFSLVENIDLTGGDDGNLDGTDPRNVPAFLRPMDPGAAPSTDAILLLGSGSPALERGDNAANSMAVDLRGMPRIVGRIDLGAYEGSSSATFDEDFDCLPDFWEVQYDPSGSATAMGADDDADGDGVSNLAEFYHGLDPTRPSNTEDLIGVSVTSEDEPRLVFRWREWAPALRYVDALPERSPDLRVWSPHGMESGALDGFDGYRSRLLIEPISPANRRHFIRLRFYRCTDI